MIKFISLSSGSYGNCYFISLEEPDREPAGILIDAGVSLRRLKRVLADHGYSYNSFSSILVTHDHLDHIRHLGSYCKNLAKPVYATPVLHQALASHTFTKDHIASCRRELSQDEWNTIIPDRIFAKCFIVPHDATQTVGYALRIGGYRLVIMTDIGRMTDEALQYASQADTVVIESNYDMDMLIGGPYTHELKMRICQGNGHLSNDECAAAIQKFYHPQLKHIFLCHLSENNNTPDRAYRTAVEGLGQLGLRPVSKNSWLLVGSQGRTVTLRALPRRTPSQLFTLDE